MFLRPIEIEMIREEARAAGEKKIKNREFLDDPELQSSGRLLHIKPARKWLEHDRRHPDLKQLFGNFWLEGELCILFADTNLGKSILAVQIADSLSRNYSIGPFNRNFSPDARVLYIDCELSTRQFMARYTDDHWGMHSFSDYFYRGEMHQDEDLLPAAYQKRMRAELEAAIKATRAQVLIIDNITYMRHTTQHANDAMPLMKTLKALKTRYNLAILVLAHTPKRNAYHPLTVNDLQGSKMLINFADSAFAIGQSQVQPHLRYLKQIKQRNRDEQYGTNNICLMSREKDISLLGFKFEHFGSETDHLRKKDAHTDDKDKQLVLQMHKNGANLRQIAGELGMHFTTVGRIVRREREKTE